MAGGDRGEMNQINGKSPTVVEDLVTLLMSDSLIEINSPNWFIPIIVYFGMAIVIARGCHLQKHSR